jgi:hypothetical protein
MFVLGYEDLFIRASDCFASVPERSACKLGSCRVRVDLVGNEVVQRIDADSGRAKAARSASSIA